jgi:hypothetical protein
VRKWITKNSAESENLNWILANTKPCPKCHRPIEKNQGCMHMTCSQCRWGGGVDTVLVGVWGVFGSLESFVQEEGCILCEASVWPKESTAQLHSHTVTRECVSSVVACLCLVLACICDGHVTA